MAAGVGGGQNKNGNKKMSIYDSYSAYASGAAYEMFMSLPFDSFSLLCFIV